VLNEHSVSLVTTQGSSQLLICFPIFHRNEGCRFVMLSLVLCCNDRLFGYSFGAFLLSVLAFTLDSDS